VGVADMDGDGHLDVVVANWGGGIPDTVSRCCAVMAAARSLRQSIHRFCSSSDLQLRILITMALSTWWRASSDRRVAPWRSSPITARHLSLVGDFWWANADRVRCQPDLARGG